MGSQPPAALGQRLECMGEEELSPARTGREGVAAEVRLTVNRIWEHKSRRIWLGFFFSVKVCAG